MRPRIVRCDEWVGGPATKQRPIAKILWGRGGVRARCGGCSDSDEDCNIIPTLCALLVQELD